MTFDLFGPEPFSGCESIAPDAWLLRGFALPSVEVLITEINAVIQTAPLRHMVTPGGLPMSVATSSCGNWGWMSDARGYRYSNIDPLTHLRWPTMPTHFRELSQAAAKAVGFEHFWPDTCLINQYEPGAKMTLHQDKNEKDFSQPIISVSLGLPAIFLLGGLARADKTLSIPLAHGDMVVWGGVSRLRFHGVKVIKPGFHPVMGARRINLTFRKAM